MDNNYSDSESDTELSNEELLNRIKENELLKNLKYEYHPTEIRDFYDFYLTKEKKINFKPVYQRKFSWNSSKQDLFIDSIINNYIIPPIILIKLENEEYEWEIEKKNVITIKSKKYDIIVHIFYTLMPTIISVNTCEIFYNKLIKK